MTHRRSGVSDTAPVVTAQVVAAHRTMTPREKLQRVLDCNAASEAMALAGLRARHPGAPEAELRRRLAELRLGRRLAAAALRCEPGCDREPPRDG